MAISGETTISETPAGRANAEHIQKTKFWNELMHDIFGPRKGGAIIFVDAQNARKGVAKTSGATAMARLLASAFAYQLQYDDLTLAGERYLTRYQNQPGRAQPSVLVIDELVGGGAGDARRAMSNENIDFGRAWQLLRTKRVVTLATLPDWNEADPRLQKYADYRIQCLEKPIGTFRPYKINVPFHSGSSNTKVRLKALNKHGDSARRINFPNMDAQNDPYYQYISERKDMLINSSSWDANELGPDEESDEEDLSPEEIERRERQKVALRLYQPWRDETEHTYEDVAQALDEVSRSWVGQLVREWRSGKHRDLVPDPTAGGVETSDH